MLVQQCVNYSALDADSLAVYDSQACYGASKTFSDIFIEHSFCFAGLKLMQVKGAVDSKAMGIGTIGHMIVFHQMFSKPI